MSILAWLCFFVVVIAQYRGFSHLVADRNETVQIKVFVFLLDRDTVRWINDSFCCIHRLIDRTQEWFNLSPACERFYICCSDQCDCWIYHSPSLLNYILISAKRLKRWMNKTWVAENERVNEEGAVCNESNFLGTVFCVLLRFTAHIPGPGPIWSLTPPPPHSHTHTHICTIYTCSYASTHQPWFWFSS